MNWFSGLLIGLQEIREHKFRSFLTMLGVILGVASLLAMFALTAGIAAGCAIPCSNWADPSASA